MSDARTAARPAAIALFLSLAATVATAQIAPIVISQNQVIDSMNSDAITWTDSSGNQRIAVLAHDGAGVPGAAGGTVYGVALRRFTYQVNGAPRTANVTTYGNGGYGGFGYVVEHSAAGSCVGDDSPLGSYFPLSSYQILFNGRHHTIVRMTQNYPRNCPNQTWSMPVTIDWLFATGRNNPVYAITYDVASAAPVNTFYDDSRAPYGELNIDGAGTLNIDGIAWGDRYKFTSTASGNVSLASGWTYNVPNLVPYVKEWINAQAGAGDATMGLVATQTLDQQDAGGSRDANFSGSGTDLRNFWTKTSADIPQACPPAFGGYMMPCPDDWAYQANGDSLFGGANNNARLTWKTQFGFVGPSTYNANNVIGAAGATPPGYPKKSYSVYVVLGQHTTSPVESQVSQIEAVQQTWLGATTGSVATSGPAGVNDGTAVTYAPPGYDPVYGTFAFTATNNQLDATIGAGLPLSYPVIVVRNYTGPLPTIYFDAPMTPDVDYFASLRPDASELWITVNSNFWGAAPRLQINMGATPAAPSRPTATFSGGVVQLSWPAVAGASLYRVYRLSVGSSFVPIGGTATTSLNDAGVAPNSAYLYAVATVDASGTSSGFSPFALATTVTFSDNPLVAGTTIVKAVHLSELRTAVDAVRALARLAPGVYTDAAAAGLVIKAKHITELRTQLDQAMSRFRNTAPYTDTTLDSTIPVKAVHFQELRDRMQ